MGCVQSFFELKERRVEDIDYLFIDNETYRDLYLFHHYYCPSKLDDPLYIYALLDSYQYQLFTLWGHLEQKYGPFNVSSSNKIPFYKHMNVRIEQLYKKYNVHKLSDPTFISSLQTQYINQEHILLGKIIEFYSGCETFYSMQISIPVRGSTIRPPPPSQPSYSRPEEATITTAVAIQRAVEAAENAAEDATQFYLDALIAPEMFSIPVQSEPESDTSSLWDYVPDESSDGFSV